MAQTITRLLSPCLLWGTKPDRDVVMRPPFTKPAGIFNMAANMTRSWCVVRFSKTMISLPLVRQTLLGGTSSMSTEGKGLY